MGTQCQRVPTRRTGVLAQPDGVRAMRCSWPEHLVRRVGGCGWLRHKAPHPLLRYLLCPVTAHRGATIGCAAGVPDASGGFCSQLQYLKRDPQELPCPEFQLPASNILFHKNSRQVAFQDIKKMRLFKLPLSVSGYMFHHKELLW